MSRRIPENAGTPTTELDMCSRSSRLAFFREKSAHESAGSGSASGKPRLQQIGTIPPIPPDLFRDGLHFIEASEAAANGAPARAQRRCQARKRTHPIFMGILSILSTTSSI